VAVAACGRGGNVSTPLGIPTAATPNAAVPFSVTTTVPIATTGTLTLPFVAPNFSGGLSIDGVTSSVTSGATVELTISNTLPAGFPALQSLARLPLAHALANSTAAQPILYIQPSFSATVTGTGGHIVLTVPTSALVPSASYYIAFFDPQALGIGWKFGWAGPASVSANILMFTLPSPQHFVARTVYALTVFAISSTGPQPTPIVSATPSASPAATPTGTSTATATPTSVQTATSAPTATSTATPAPSSSPKPTATPTPVAGVLTVTPTVILFPPSLPQTLIIHETGYTGTFTQTNSCAGISPIATFAAASGSGPTWTLMVSGANAGTCTITITDASAQHVTASISVTNSGFSIQSLDRNN